MTKTNGVTLVSAGATTTYTVVVSNAGPDAANGAIVTDPAAAGLTKTSVVCAAAGGATCPASPTVAQVEAGLAIPALPFGGSVTLHDRSDGHGRKRQRHEHRDGDRAGRRH